MQDSMQTNVEGDIKESKKDKKEESEKNDRVQEGEDDTTGYLYWPQQNLFFSTLRTLASYYPTYISKEVDNFLHQTYFGISGS